MGAKIFLLAIAVFLVLGIIFSNKKKPDENV